MLIAGQDRALAELPQGTAQVSSGRIDPQA
jgi:hypothetical protein